MMLRRLGVHLALVVLASVFAYRAWQPKQTSDIALKPGETDVWRAADDAVTRVHYQGKRAVVTIDRRKDKRGTWYDVLVAAGPNANLDAPDAAPNPHAPHGQGKLKPGRYVSVTAAERVMKMLGTLRAKRSLGKIPAERAAAYGLDDPVGTVEVEVAGTTHKLTVGAPTPGQSHRYARHEATANVYVIDAGIVRDLQSGSSLGERALQTFRFSDVDKVELQAAGNTRTVVRSGTEGRRFWANADSPDKNEEQVGNWLQKVNRLRPDGFLGELPPSASQAVQLRYGKSGSALGALTLYRDSADPKAFYVATDHLRLPAKVGAALAEQVADDAKGLFEAAE